MSSATGYRTLHQVVGDQPLPAPTRRRDGWAVRVPGDTYRSGPIGRALAAVRLQRHRFAGGPPQALAVLVSQVAAEITGDALLGRSGQLIIPGDHHGQPAILRIASRADGDIERHIAALERFGSTSAVVPRLLACHHEQTLTVTVEQRLDGRAPQQVTASLLAQVAAATDELNAVVGRRSASTADHVVLALGDRALDLLPDFGVAETVRPLATFAAERLQDVPTGFEHGDLWHRNLLTTGPRLSGLIDWDAWRSDGVPQVDRMTLLMTWLRLQQGRSSGAALADRVWQSDKSLLSAARLGEAHPDAIGILTWMTGIVGTVERMPRRARDHDWIARSVLSARPALDWAA